MFLTVTISLQAERTVLHNTLKENKIERPSLPTMPVPVSPMQSPTPANSPSDKKVFTIIINKTDTVNCHNGNIIMNNVKFGLFSNVI